MKLRNTAIALGVGAATAVGLSLLKVDKPVVIGSTAVVIGAGLIVSSKKQDKGSEKVDSAKEQKPKSQSEPTTAQDFFDRGNAKVAGFDTEGAIADYTKSLELKPDQSAVYRFRGLAKKELGDLQGAIKDWEKGSNLGDNESTDLLTRHNKVSNKDENISVESDANSLFISAKEKGSSGDFHGAIDDYTKSLRINPKNVEALNGRGLTKSLLGEHQDALEDFSKSLSIQQNGNSAYMIRSNTKIQLRDFVGAIEDLIKAIEIEPEKGPLYRFRGLCKMELGDLKGAYKDWIKALNLGDEEVSRLLEEYNIRISTSYYNSGNQKSNDRDKEGAIQDYNISIKLNSSNADSYINRGCVKDDIGDYKGAIEDYKRAIEINPDDKSIYYNLGNAKRHQEDYRGAIDAYTTAIKLDPNSLGSYIHRGNTMASLGDHQGAIQDYKKALEIEPANPYIYMSIGSSYISIKNYQDAIDYYSKGIEIDPNLFHAYRSRGKAKNELGDLQGAIQDWGSASKLGDKESTKLLKKYTSYSKEDVSNVEKKEDNFLDENIKLSKEQFIELANEQIEWGKYNFAIISYNKAIELDPKYALAYYERGNVFEGLKQFRNAISDLNKAIELDPNNHKAYLSRANCKIALKDQKGSCSDYKRAASLGSEIATEYLNGSNGSWCKEMTENYDLEKLCRDQYQNGEYKEAIVNCDKLIELEPENIYAYIYRGSSKDELGDSKSAIQDYNKVIEIDPRDWNAYYNRGVTLRDSGNTTGAINDFTKTIELNPECAIAFRNRGNLRLESIDIKNACSDWKKAADLGDEVAVRLLDDHCKEFDEKELDAIKSKKEGVVNLPISRDAFCHALEVKTLMFKWKEESEMSVATYTTLWNIKTKADPEVCDSIEDDWNILVTLMKETTVIDSLKQWIEYAFDDSGAYDQMERDWDIGNSDSCKYKDEKSFIADVYWEMVMFIVREAWEDSQSEERMKTIMDFKKVSDEYFRRKRGEHND